MNSGKQECQSLYGWQNADATQAHSYIWPAIKSFLPQEKVTILDLGCGNGYLAAQLAMMGHTVIGIDVSPDGITIAKKNYPHIHFETRSIYDNFNDLVIHIDMVISSEVIEHLYSPNILLKKAFLILRPGGQFIVTTPYHGYLKNLALSLVNKWDSHHPVDWEGGHIKFFSPKTLSAMLKTCGFINIRFNNAGRVKWLWKSMVCCAEKPVLTHD